MLRTRLTGRDDDQRRSLALVLAPLINARTSSIPLAAGAILVSTKLVVLSACAVAAVLLVAWTLLHSSPSGPTSLANDQAGAVAALAPSTAHSSDATAHDADEALGATGDSEPRAASPTAASAARRIRIVRADTDAPIAGARIHWATAREIEAKQAELLPHIAVDVGTQIPLLGHELSSDAEGFVALPEVERTIWVAGQHGRLWASSYFAGTGPLDDVLALFLDAPLFVQVVDADGVPRAGVPVAVNRSSARDERSNDVRITGRDGIATFEHALAERFAGRPEGTLAVKLAFPHALASPLVVDANPWPREPLRIVCPLVGSVRIKLLDAAGAPYLGRVHANFRATALVGSAPGSAIAEGRDGELVLDPVGIGLELGVSALPIGTPGGWRSHGELSIEGPQAEGEVVVAEFRMVNDKMTVTARALDDAGLPLREVELLARASYATGDAATTTKARTDDDGYLTLLVDPSHSSDVCPQLQIVAPALHKEVDVALPSCAMSSTIELGDLRLVLAPLLATGRVVDNAHAPIAGANVSLLMRQADGEAPPELAKLGYVTVEWEPVVIRETRSEPDGRFEIRGTERGGGLALKAIAHGFAESRNVEFTAGATEIELVLARESVRDLTGRLRCSHSSVFEFIGVQARSATGTSECWGIDRNGRFRAMRVPALPVDLDVRVDGSNDVLLTIPGIANVDDPRLRSIDIDEFVRVYEIDLESSLGARIDEARVGYWHRMSEDMSRLCDTITLDGHATIASTQRELEIDVKAAGFRNQTVKAVPGRTRVVLQPGFDVVLQVPDSLAITEAGFAFEVNLKQDGHGRGNEVVNSSLRGEREIRVALPRDGEWDLEWRLLDQTLNGRSVLRNITITVGDGIAAPVSTLDFPRSDLDARIAKWLTHHQR
jgi:hypothetical protein